MRIVLTGTPGTGKSSLAKSLAEALDWPLLDVRKLIMRKKMFHVNKKEREKTVHVNTLKKAVDGWFEDHPAGIAESHLLCEFCVPADVVVVLRCNPSVLEKRLKKRGYSQKKIRDNLFCEALDYCTLKTEENDPKSDIVEIDATRKIRVATLWEKIMKRKSDRVKWSAWLKKNA